MVFWRRNTFYFYILQQNKPFRLFSNQNHFCLGFKGESQNPCRFSWNNFCDVVCHEINLTKIFREHRLNISATGWVWRYLWHFRSQKAVSEYTYGIRITIRWGLHMTANVNYCLVLPLVTMFRGAGKPEVLMLSTCCSIKVHVQNLWNTLPEGMKILVPIVVRIPFSLTMETIFVQVYFERRF